MMYLGQDPVAVTALGSGSGEDTKNTAGATDTSDKLFIVGAKTQTENPQTYTQDTAYVGTDGCLYSNGQKVLTSHQDISGKAPLASPSLTGTPTAPTAASGTNTTQIATTAFVQDAVNGVSGGSGGVPFGVCSTAANTAIKEVTIAGITELTNGLRISVYFTNKNSASGVSLNVNNLGAARILRRHDSSPNLVINNEILKACYDFTYYDSKWLMMDQDRGGSDRAGLVYLYTDNLPTNSAGSAIDIAAFNTFYLTHTIPQVCVHMENDQYTYGLGEDEYRFVLKFYHVDNTGKTYYTSTYCVDEDTIRNNYYEGLTLNIYGCDQNGVRTLLDTGIPYWYPAYNTDLSSVYDNQFTFVNGVMTYIFKANATTLNLYHHLECVVSVNIQGITMYHPSQDLTFDLSSLSHDTIEIKNIGLDISEVLASETHKAYTVFVKSMFDIPDDTTYSTQIIYSFDENDEVYYGPIVYGCDFHVPDWIMVNDNPGYGYTPYYDDLLGNWLTTDINTQLTYMLSGRMFVCSDGLYITDFRLCKKLPFLPDGGSSLWQGGSF